MTKVKTDGQWVAWCETCGKQIDKANNGAMMEAAAKVHCEDTGGHRTICGLEYSLPGEGKKADSVEDLQGQKKALQGSLQELSSELVETKRNAKEAQARLLTEKNAELHVIQARLRGIDSAVEPLTRMSNASTDCKRIRKSIAIAVNQIDGMTKRKD